MRIVLLAIPLISELLPSIKEAWPEAERAIYSAAAAGADPYSALDTIFNILITAIIITLIILYHQRIINTAIGLTASLINQRYILMFRRDIVSRANLNIFMAFGIIVFSFVLARYTYEQKIALAGVTNAGITLRFLITAPAIPLYLIAKKFSFQLLAWTNRERSFNFLYGMNIVCTAFSLLLILSFILIAAIIPHISPHIIKICLISSFSAGILLFIVRGYKLIISRGFSHSFWFLYLCTLEFLPFILAIEFLRV